MYSPYDPTVPEQNRQLGRRSGVHRAGEPQRGFRYGLVEV